MVKALTTPPNEENPMPQATKTAEPDEKICGYCGTGETGCAMAGPMTAVDGVPYHVDVCAVEGPIAV